MKTTEPETNLSPHYQLLQALAKMLPGRVVFTSWTPYGGTEQCHKLLWLACGSRGREVYETELLSLCWLVEETIGSDENWRQYCCWIAKTIVGDDRPKAAGNHYHVPNRVLIHATWQQRVQALVKVKAVQ